MREVFRGWKRKIGIMMLALACLFAAVWVATLDESSDFPSLTLMLNTGEGNLIMKGQIWLAPFAPSINGDEFGWKIPIWSIVLPLTLISAFLLLKKPKTSTQKKIPEPITDE